MFEFEKCSNFKYVQFWKSLNLKTVQSWKIYDFEKKYLENVHIWKLFIFLKNQFQNFFWFLEKEIIHIAKKESK
jgi:hypothetical protein